MEELAQEVYRIRRTVASQAILGASVLHPRHAVPPEQNQILQALAQGQAIPTPSLFKIMTRLAIGLFSAAYDTLIILVLRLFWGPTFKKKFAGPYDVVIKTWVPQPQNVGESSDFYFGTLASRLKEKGLSVVFLGGDGRSDDGRWLSKLKEGLLKWEFTRACLTASEARYAPEWLLIPFYGPLWRTVQQIRWSVAFWWASRNRPTPLIQQSLASVLSLDLLRPYTTRNNQFFYIGRALSRRWKPSVFITPYEGQPWEKSAWMGVLKKNPLCHIVGYQHTVVMKHSLSLLSPNHDTWERTVPDVVLCTGDTTKKMLEAVHQKEGSKTVVLGSFRRAPHNGLDLKPRPHLKTVLVLPEGIRPQAVHLFDFSMQVAKRCPAFKFIFRCHPVLPFATVEKDLAEPVSSFSNIEVSQGRSLDDDFARSSVLFYSGSSTVLYAILKGLKPFFIKDNSPVWADPLFEMKTWRENALSSEGLASQLDQYSRASLTDLEADWKKAEQYVQSYTQPVQTEAMDSLMKDWLAHK